MHVANTPILRSIKMLDEQMVEIIFNDTAKITLTGIDEVFNVLYKVTGERKVARLLVIGKGISINDDIRYPIIQENRRMAQSIIAEAIVVTSIAQRISTNFYMRFIRKEYPAQCFSNIDKARQWLASQIRGEKPAAHPIPS